MKFYLKYIVIGFLFTLIWSASLFYFYERIMQAETDNINKMALKEAHVAFEKDLTYRRWVAGLGGLYAEVGPNLRPNAYLEVPNRDIVTSEGLEMTMVNPAYMMRMVYGLMKSGTGLQGHITSLTPIRPANSPAPWEAEVLESYKSNPRDFHEVVTVDGEQYLHFMRPMITEQRCLKCHAQQGYQIGEVRGGISVTVPMSAYAAALAAFKAETLFSFRQIWAVGTSFIVIVFFTLGRFDKKRQLDAQIVLASEKRLRAIFNQAAVGVALINEEHGSFVKVNDEFCNMLGYSYDEMLKINDYELTHPDDKEMCLNRLNQEFSSGNHSIHMEKRYIHKDGSVLWCEQAVSTVSRKEQGTESYVVVVKNITSRKKAEEELQKTRNYLSNIIDSMPSVLVGVDPEGNVTHWNIEAERISNMPSNEVVGRPLVSALPYLQNELDKVLAAMRERTIEKESMQIRTEKGRTRYEDITIYPLISNGVQGAVIRIDNVTERITLEQIMVQSEKMMSVGGLAAGMAHEINNPLAGIMGHAQNLKKRIFSDLNKNFSVAEECDVPLEKVQAYMEARDVPKMIDGIMDSGQRAARIVSNMLSFSRKSSKLLEENNLATLLDKTIELAGSDYNLKKYYDFRKIEIVRDYSDIPLVACNGTEIQQVFLNLLKNGAEAMTEKDYESGGPKFICRIFSDEDMVVVEIEDNGPGVALEAKNRVFDPFYTSKKVGEGTGLGLSVSYFIITKQHGGSMDVDSVVGEWTRFTIKLPVF
jgi:PAS domain S-box-containing protein